MRPAVALAVMVLAVGAVIAAVHWPVLHAQALSFDDVQFMTDNRYVTRPGVTSAWRLWTEVLHPSTVAGYYLPLTMSSLMLDYAMGGRYDDLRVFHRTNIILHILCSMLVVLLLYRLFGASIPAAIVGLIFGLHPLTVEPIAWVGERKTLLAAVFAFASILSYVQYGFGEKRRWMGVSVALYLLALVSKPTVLMIPLLLVLLDYWPLKRLTARAIVEKWPYVLLSIVLGAITVVSQSRAAGIMPTDYRHWPLRICYLLAFYLAKIVWPANLSSVYDPPARFAPSNPVVLMSVIVVLLVTISSILLLRRTRAPLVGWLFFIVALAPTLGVVNYSWVIASDKYLYLPGLGLVVMLASGLAAAWRWRPRGLAAPTLALLFVALAILTAEARGARATLRNWKDSVTLFRHMEAVAPRSAQVQYQLGMLVDDPYNHRETIRHFERAIELDPGFATAHSRLGLVLAGTGDLEGGIEHLRRAQALQPNDVPTLCNLGTVLFMAGRLDEAAAQFDRALRLQPTCVDALYKRGSIFVGQGRLAEGVEEFRRVLAVEPANAWAHFRLSMALVRLGGPVSETIEHLREAVRLRPDWPDALDALARLLATTPDPTVRDPAEALRLAGRAVELTGRRDPRMLDTFAAALASAGRFDEAAREAGEALRLTSESRGDTLARGIRSRMRMYERGVAYREPAPGTPSPRHEAGTGRLKP